MSYNEAEHSTLSSDFLHSLTVLKYTFSLPI